MLDAGFLIFKIERDIKNIKWQKGHANDQNQGTTVLSN